MPARAVSTVDPLSEVWHRVVTTQPPPSAAVVAGTAVVAAVLVLLPRTWRVTRHVVTIVHEGAHGVAALLTGRRLSGIRLHSDTSGVTVSVGRPRGPGMVLTSAAGYVGPGTARARRRCTARGGSRGRPAVGGAGAARAAAGADPQLVRAVVGAGQRGGGPRRLRAAAGAGAVGVRVPPGLVPAAVRSTTGAELQAERRRRRSSTSDADQLARLTGLPGLVWVGIFLAVTAGALVEGGRWLLGDLG